MKKIVIAAALCFVAMMFAFPGGSRDVQACPACPVVGECPDPCGDPCADQLQIEIERALRDNRRIAKFYLPDANGGNLTLVRQIVSDTIDHVNASGEGTNLATTKLAGADIEIAAGRYKRAWSFLSQAYFEAIKITGEAQ